MQKTSGARRVGSHRKQDTSAKRRVAMVAVAASAVTSAGAAGGAAGASTGAQHNAGSRDVKLAADTTILAQGEGAGAAGSSSAPAAGEAPQILEVPQAVPAGDLAGQLDSAMRFAAQRAAADLAARAPMAAKPAEGTMTSPFGPRWGGFHNGIDIANAIGTPILAVEDGTVIDSGPASGFGQWIRIKHEDGSVSVYGHMQTLDVAVGQKVTAGQKIAGMGSMGFSTGSHLHFEIHPDGTNPVDPIPWLAAHGITV
ncbi:M23 family metallopeptidase [Corynebacterium heidelbergense]|uniref:Endopeptidase n=1 Tax=Corynebacterium heidelbergense TaxID=2055947 RepID=A0A364V688_9CORY|nr:M23 family metallopeptidase [Corynebacterium heidelbergense]RAV32139.1 endopeptidase [Corynebacterium heidelbergense]